MTRIQKKPLPRNAKKRESNGNGSQRTQSEIELSEGALVEVIEKGTSSTFFSGEILTAEKGINCPHPSKVTIKIVAQSADFPATKKTAVEACLIKNKGSGKPVYQINGLEDELEIKHNLFHLRPGGYRQAVNN